MRLFSYRCTPPIFVIVFLAFTTSFFLCPEQPLVPEIIDMFLPNLLVA